MASETEIRELFRFYRGREPKLDELSRWTGHGFAEVEQQLQQDPDALAFSAAQIAGGIQRTTPTPTPDPEPPPVEMETKPGGTVGTDGTFQRVKTPSGAMSASEIARLAYQAGFRGESLVIAVAVALGESGGRAGVEGDTHLTNAKWGPSVGLWQVRTLNAERGKGTWRDYTKLKDPLYNARAAFAISGGGRNFKPWTVYSKGIYRNHLSAARAAVRAIS